MEETLGFGDIELSLFNRRMEAGDRWTSTLPPGIWFGIITDGHLKTRDRQIGLQDWRAGDALVYALDKPCDSMHEVLQTGSLSCIFIRVKLDARDRYLPGGPNRTVIRSRRLIDTRDQRLLRICTEMLEHEFDDPARLPALASRSFGAIELITREMMVCDASASNPFAERIRAIGRHMLANLANVQTTDALAKRFGMTVRRMNDGFKSTYGLSAHDYLKEQRLQRAMSILRTEPRPVSSVAYEVGYHPSHFSTEFRRAYGCSPSEISQTEVSLPTGTG